MQNNYKNLNGIVFFAGLLFLIVLVVMKVFNLSFPIAITNQPVTELSVAGTGQVEVVPDLANVSVGITSNGKNVADVQKSINTTNNNMVTALTKLGIKKSDISTSGYTINPTYDYTKGQTITGYNGSATLTIKVHDTTKLPDVISAATTAGANQIYGTSYSVDNPDKFRQEARSQAIANAKIQAQKLADELGIKLGKVTNIIENTGSSDQPLPMAFGKALNANAAPAPDLQAGSQTITSTVTLLFEKK